MPEPLLALGVVFFVIHSDPGTMCVILCVRNGQRFEIEKWVDAWNVLMDGRLISLVRNCLTLLAVTFALISNVPWGVSQTTAAVFLFVEFYLRILSTIKRSHHLHRSLAIVYCLRFHETVKCQTFFSKERISALSRALSRYAAILRDDQNSVASIKNDTRYGLCYIDVTTSL